MGTQRNQTQANTKRRGRNPGKAASEPAQHGQRTPAVAPQLIGLVLSGMPLQSQVNDVKEIIRQCVPDALASLYRVVRCRKSETEILYVLTWPKDLMEICKRAQQQLSQLQVEGKRLRVRHASAEEVTWTQQHKHPKPVSLGGQAAPQAIVTPSGFTVTRRH